MLIETAFDEQLHASTTSIVVRLVARNGAAQRYAVRTANVTT
ncbi:hypothetical protein [Pseudonocardia sp. HH130630-07]|nr:hypothetical protein [Pseudonocardia sp. HH130630-07]